MLPLQPTTLFTELAREHGAIREQAFPTHRTTADPDAYFAETNALAPDPLYMGLRAYVQTSPLGSLLAWIDQKREEREERRFAAESRTPTARISPRPIPVAEDREDLAA
jgi:hypothetical protein